MQMEHQVVGPQTRHVTARVEPLKRVVEVIGQVNLLEAAPGQHRLFPVLSRHRFGCGIINRLPVVRTNSVSVKSEKVTAHFHEPTDLYGVVEMFEERSQTTDQFTRPDPGLLDLLAGQPSRMCQFGVIVVPENIRECF